MRSSQVRNPLALTTAMLYLLSLLSGASAVALRERAEGSPSLSSETSASATGASQSASASVSPASGTTSSSDAPTRPTMANTPAGASPVPTAASNGTTSSNSTTPEAPSNSTSTNTIAHGNSTCHIDRLDVNRNSGPFCFPANNQNVTADKIYDVVWDNSDFEANKTTTLSINYLPNGTVDAHDSSLTSVLPVAWSTQLPTDAWSISVKFDAEWLKGHESSNLTLFITEDNSDKSPYPGPMLTLISANSTNDRNQSSSSHNNGDNKKKIGEKVGIPIGTIFFFGIILALAFCFRRQILAKCSSMLGGAKTGGGGKGYTGSNARRSAGLGNDAFAVGHQRGDSFNDEPMRGGVELQDRGGGGGDGGGPGNPNVFRDELDRQRGSRR